MKKAGMVLMLLSTGYALAQTQADCKTELQELRSKIEEIHSELSTEALAKIKGTMEEARSLYQAGDNQACGAQLKALKKEYLSTEDITSDEDDSQE